MKTLTSGVLTDEQIEALRVRNQQKADAVIKEMGTKYACHPVNLLKRNPLHANFTPRMEKPVQGVLQLPRAKGAA